MAILAMISSTGWKPVPREFCVRHFGYFVPAVLSAGALIGFVACRQQARPEPEPLLLLAESSGAEGLESAAGPAADNSRCHVCHINFENEALTSVHARAGIGCERCHGASDAHCSDEDNVTPPGTMYPVEKIKSFCMGCHPKEKIGIAVHNSVMAETNPAQACCTNCHGDHRLNYRTRQWNKVTGALIKDDRVRMTTDQMLEREQ
jgi:hypothetical protein